MLLEWTDTNMVGILSKWRNLISALGYHNKPLSPILLLLILDSFCLPSAVPFLPPIPVLGFTSNSCFSCHDLFWPSSSFGLDLGIRLLCVTHPPLLVPTSHLTLGLCVFALNSALWGFWLLLSGPALPGQLFTLELTLMFPVLIASHFSVPDSSWSNFTVCGWGRTDSEGVSDKFGGDRKVS